MKKTEMIEYTEQKWYQRFFEKIRTFFNKKKDTNNEKNFTSCAKTNEESSNEFMETMQNNARIVEMQRKLKAGKIKIADLSNDDLKEMINLYKTQIEVKRARLMKYRNKMILNKKEA